MTPTEPTISADKHPMWKVLTDQYDYFMVDLWGVMIDGVNRFPRALDFLQHLRDEKKEVVFLSNTPDRSSSLADRLTHEFGITSNYYDHIITSGETVQTFFRENQEGFGKTYRIIGIPYYSKLMEDFDLTQVSEGEDFEFVVMTSYEEDFVTEENLLKMKGRGVKALCVNPDITVSTLDGHTKYCAGEMARRYKEIGGEVVYTGKPHQLIYELGIKKFSTADKSKTIMIGDNTYTDVLGAHNFGISSALVNNPIESKEATFIIPDFSR